MRLQLVLFCLSICGELPQSTLKTLPQSTLPDKPPEVSGPPTLPAGAAEYEHAEFTQSISVVSDRDSIVPVPIKRLEEKWRVSGGMVGLKGWHSKKYRLLPPGKPEMTWIDNIQVMNSLGSYQPNRGLLREFPVGTEYHDVLTNDDGQVFEHRLRKKGESGWSSKVIYTNKAARPPGYTGLKVTCASCHDEAGSGKYGLALVPGGDTVISDPLNWTLVYPR